MTAAVSSAWRAKSMEDADIEETNSKLGVLWTCMGLRSGFLTADLHGSWGGGGARDSTNDAALGAKHSKLEHQTRGLQEQVSDRRSHTPAVPKAVQMPGLTADRFYTAVIASDNFERPVIPENAPKNKHPLYLKGISAK